MSECLVCDEITGEVEGAPRPAARRYRRSASGMPGLLAVDEEKRWRDPQLEEVARIVDLLTRTGPRSVGPADQPRWQGRFAPW